MSRHVMPVDRSIVDHALARLREGLAQALPLKPPAPRVRQRPCPHCQKDVDAGLTKCPHCQRLFRLERRA